MKTLKIWFTNGGIRTRSIISQLLLVVELKFAQNKAKTYAFHSMVKYATYRFCISMNINKTLKIKRKSLQI